MKTLILSLFSFFIITACFAQDPTFLNENFDLSCASTSGFPQGWHQYHIVGNESWVCTPGKGINNSPCMSMSGYTTHYNIDTNWFITPELNLSSYNKIYFNFFDKYSRAGDSLTVYVNDHYGEGNPLCDSCSWTEIAVPFSQGDTVWRQHQIDLTPYKNKPLYVGFRYTSTTSSGSIWYLDSVFTTQINTGVGQVAKENIPVTVIGIPGSTITLECSLPVAGTYTLGLFDITGRALVNREMMVSAGLQRLKVNDLNLPGGVYIVKLGNAMYTGVAKAVIQ